MQPHVYSATNLTARRIKAKRKTYAKSTILSILGRARLSSSIKIVSARTNESDEERDGIRKSRGKDLGMIYSGCVLKDDEKPGLSLYLTLRSETLSILILKHYRFLH